ncbi:hypothetical protein A2U01_0112094, partial [Trifolium medium]|nr:hypothetical protein [Trifolium medium]
MESSVVSVNWLLYLRCATDLYCISFDPTSASSSSYNCSSLSATPTACSAPT